VKSKCLIALAALILSTSSCVGIDVETKEKMDAATAQIKRLNDNLEAFQKDIQALTIQLKWLSDHFKPKQP
jgi:peptidoglycan hydrolase CwlO-like protein